MSIRTRIFLGFFAIIGLGFYYLLDWILDDLTPRYRESTEEPLVDAARVLASFASVTANGDQLDVPLFRAAFDDAYSHVFNAQIYDFIKTEVDFRVYMTDAAGKVVFDSDGGRDEGADYSRWLDVRKTLAGEYGARTSRDTPGDPRASVLYVASPIQRDGQIIGVLTVGKPTRNANQFIESAKRKIVIGGISAGTALLLTGLLLSAMITRPIQALTEYALAVRDGKRVQLPKLTGRELKALGTAFEEMRDALEGKQYVERYVQTLTHEIKSPLSAIQGAAELLHEEMPPERREQFFHNIRSETERIKGIVEKMLLLSSLEARKTAADIETIDLAALVRESLDSLLPLITAKRLTLTPELAPEVNVQGERFLIRHAIVNLLQNAVDFTPEDGTITITLTADPDAAELTITDSGPGIPDYAEDRVFERFYSLKRPDTGKKSSGLGLSLVQEVASLHQGTITLTNAANKGATAVLRLPRE